MSDLDKQVANDPRWMPTRQELEDLLGRYRSALEALNEAGPLMEEAMSRPLWGSLQGSWRKRALAWHRKYNTTLREVQAVMAEQEKEL